MKPLTTEEIDQCIDQAYTLYARWNSKIRGQVIMPQDSLDYWVALSTQKYVLTKLGLNLEEN